MSSLELSSEKFILPDTAEEDFRCFAKLVAERVEESKFRPETVVGIGRVGTMIGPTVADLLGAQYGGVLYLEKMGEIIHPRGTNLTLTHEQKTKARTLVIDDYIHSGLTTEWGKYYFASHGNRRVRIAVIFNPNKQLDNLVIFAIPNEPPDKFRH